MHWLCSVSPTARALHIGSIALVNVGDDLYYFIITAAYCSYLDNQADLG